MALQLFSREMCEQWKRQGLANTPLALYANVDFALRDVTIVPDAKYRDAPDLLELIDRYNNVAVEYRMVLEVIK
jgi:hypothetical protein